jgi:putative RNA 2'-phosphotransferase
MTKDRTIQVSKFLSLVLRHQPEKIGITLDPAGWVDVNELLSALARHGSPVSPEELQQVVATSDKKRFAFSEDGQQIRASQGHSVEVELGYQPAIPPAVLFHGTVERFLPSIQKIGLIKGQRHHVHLSRDQETATKVGQRRGKPVILTINSAAMAAEGIVFYLSANCVWLTDAVPARFIEFPKER